MIDIDWRTIMYIVMNVVTFALGWGIAYRMGRIYQVKKVMCLAEHRLDQLRESRAAYLDHLKEHEA